MSEPAGDIPLIDDTNPPSPTASSSTSREKSIGLNKKNITQREKQREAIQSTRSKTSKISASSSDKKSVNKPTSRTITKPNQKPIQPSNSKSPGKSLPDKSKLKDRPGSSQTSPEKSARNTNFLRPNTGSGFGTSRTTAGRSKPRGENDSDTVRSKSNTVVANKSKAINRGSSTTTSVVNKTTTKQVSNNKVDSKSKIKEPPHQQNTNNVAIKKILAEKSLKDIGIDVGGRNLELTGGGSHPVMKQRHHYTYILSGQLLRFLYRCEIVQNDNI